MKKTLLLFILISTSKAISAQIYTNTFTAIGSNIINEKIEVLNSDYFEIDLKRQVNGLFKAEKDLKRPQSQEDKLIVMEIVDKNKNLIKFNAPTEFLNFMSKNGYEMVDQKKGKYNIEYTFKKKK